MDLLSLANPAKHGAPMPKPGPKKSPLSTYLPTELQQALQAYSDRTGIPITRIVEDALRAHLSRVRGDDQPTGGAA